MTTAHADADRSPVEQLARAIGWVAFLAAGHVGLMAAGQALPPPPLSWPPDDLLQWLQTNDAVNTAFSLLRLVGLGVVWYLAAITALMMVAHVSGLRPLGWLADRLALPWAKRLINHVLGAGLALTLAGGIVPVAGATMAMASPGPAAAAPAPDDGAVTMSLIDDPTDAPVTMERLPDEPGAPRAETQPPIRRSALGRATVSMHLLENETSQAPTSWTIAPGDHLWHVAASTLEAQWQREPTDTEIAGYWQQLIDHNRSRLAVPDDPDLVYPGQVFELPPVPPAR